MNLVYGNMEVSTWMKRPEMMVSKQSSVDVLLLQGLVSPSLGVFASAGRVLPKDWRWCHHTRGPYGRVCVGGQVGLDNFSHDVRKKK